MHIEEKKTFITRDQIMKGNITTTLFYPLLNLSELITKKHSYYKIRLHFGFLKFTEIKIKGKFK